MGAMIVLLAMGALVVYVAIRYRGPDRYYLMFECPPFAALGFAVLTLT